MSIFKNLIIFIIFLLVIGVFLGLNSPFHTEGISRASLFERWAYSITMSIHHYYIEFNEFPQGTSEEICEALTGKNPKQEIFISRRCSSLRDPWDTAYDIHVSPRGEIKIISAGENQIFGDKDDYIFEYKIEVAAPTEEATPTQKNII